MNNPYLIVNVAVIVAVVVTAWLVVWAASFIRYGVTPTHLQITFFRLPLRRIRLDDIKAISTKPVWFAEKWYSTLHPADRLLVIRRHGGWCKNLAITPRHRFMFRAELLHARDGTDPLTFDNSTLQEETVTLDRSKPDTAKSSGSSTAKSAA